MDKTTLLKVGYGLYVLTAKDDEKDNGCIINTLMQATSSPSLIGVITVNKQNHTHDMIMKTQMFNVSILTTETPFEIFEHFGFQSGSAINKFEIYTEIARSENGIIYLTKNTNAFLSFNVTETIDFGTHTMFKAEIVNGEVIGNAESLTYAYYQKHIKPRPQATSKTGYRCNICGYIYVGEDLPGYFVCPLCKHGASDFVKIS